MELHAYRFRSTWSLARPAGQVYAALRTVEDYPEWWPQVRTVSPTSDEDTYDMVVRSLLPYDLVFRSSRSVEDPDAGVLEARLEGDLVGFSRWSVRPAGAVTTAVFEEEVEARKPLLRRLAPVARPAFVANHALMMRAGRRGLRAYLAGLARRD